MAVVARSFALAALLFAPALAACSGAADQDVLEPSADANDTSSTDPAPPGASTTPGTSAGSKGAADPTPGPTPTGDDPAAPPNAPDQPACTPEVEPNNDLSKATPFTSSVCGKIGSASDLDFVSFTVPKDADVVRVAHTEKNGNALYRYFLEGTLLGLQGDELEVVPGGTYTIQVRLDKSNGGGGSLPSYQIDVAFH